MLDHITIQPGRPGFNRFDPERVEVIQMSNMRRRIAEHMVYSKRVSPHTYTVAEVDMTRIAQFRDQVKGGFEKREGFSITYYSFFIKAVIEAIKQVPQVNSVWSDEQGVIIKRNINIGVPFPLCNRNQGNIQAARAQRLRAVDEETRVGNDLTSKVAEVFERFPFVDVAFGPGQIHKLAEFLTSDSLTAQGYFEFEAF